MRAGKGTLVHMWVEGYGVICGEGWESKIGVKIKVFKNDDDFMWVMRMRSSRAVLNDRTLESLEV